MELVKLCENYFKPFENLRDYRAKNSAERRAAIAKIISYILIFPPLVMGVVYGLSLLGRAVTVKINPSQLDQITNKMATAKLQTTGAGQSTEKEALSGVARTSKPVQQPGEPTLKSGPFTLQSGYDTGAMIVIGDKVNPGNPQQENSTAPGYNWKVQYQKQDHLKGYASQATNAVIACRGTFSNYQQTAFSDHVTGLTFKSAEHMFQTYKFPEKDTAARFALKNAETPDEARCEALKHFKPSENERGVSWGLVNKELMVFVQLAKALDPSNGLLSALSESGDLFIIEDTSSRMHDQHPERTWGDNGNGEGTNYLGWAQMKARDYIRSKEGKLTQQDVTDYYNAHVKQMIELYWTYY